MSTDARTAELHANLAAVRARIAAVADTDPAPVLVAVSKYKPAADIAAAYDAGQRDFGENYAQELADKAPALPADIRWHFIGHLQSNKAKAVAAIPNLHTLHTLSSTKLASALNAARAPDAPPLRVLLQVNTSAEDAKSGLPPLHDPAAAPASPLAALARHVLAACPRLRLAGLMTIGALANSRAADDDNADFAALARTRDLLHAVLAQDFPPERWGGALLLSMGMSADYEAAIRAGSGIVRVGSSIFGERPPKGESS